MSNYVVAYTASSEALNPHLIVGQRGLDRGFLDQLCLMPATSGSDSSCLSCGVDLLRFLLRRSESATSFGWFALAKSAGAVRLEPSPERWTTAAAKNEAAICLLEQWMADDSGYDERAWQVAKRAIEANRLSHRKRLSE